MAFKNKLSREHSIEHEMLALGLLINKHNANPFIDAL